MALFRGPCCLHLPTQTNAQMAALTLPNVGYATNADHGAGCNIHPPAKQWCGTRLANSALANSALALQYGHKVAWKSPSFAASLGAVVVSPQLGGGEFERKGLSSLSLFWGRISLYSFPSMPFPFLRFSHLSRVRALRTAWRYMRLTVG